MGLVEYLTNIMPIVISNFYIMINSDITRSIVVNNVDVEMIK